VERRARLEAARGSGEQGCAARSCALGYVGRDGWLGWLNRWV
jgi:hypothetical protein